MMKKIVALLLVALLPVFALMGCNKEQGKTTYTITFIQEGQTNIVKTVEKGQNLTDIPTPVSVVGHDVVWNVTDFSNVKSNLTVNAVATPKTFYIYYTIAEVSEDNGIVLEKTSQAVIYGDSFTLISASYVKEGVTYALVSWLNDGETFTGGVWTYEEDITLVTGGFRPTTDQEWS
ncbi:MAG: hypothetical protein IJV99_01445 [Clostridia bacterium]|nr:hypothetical protein [Clostridia bacterium]